jgi:hypothetical protein
MKLKLVYKEKEKIRSTNNHREMWESGTVTVETSWYGGGGEKRHEVRDNGQLLVIWSQKTPRQILKDYLLSSSSGTLNQAWASIQ